MYFSTFFSEYVNAILSLTQYSYSTKFSYMYTSVEKACKVLRNLCREYTGCPGNSARPIAPGSQRELFSIYGHVTLEQIQVPGAEIVPLL